MGVELLPALVIARKRDGGELSAEEIRAFVRGACGGAEAWPDYQLAALLMAIFLRGMSPAETAELTRAVMESGRVADLSGIRRPKVDKHSTGGVGDKISLIVAPLVAACGAAVPMISGRGLGHTGGTLDKLEAIPGFRTDLSLADYAGQVERAGLAIIAQSAELAPADRKLYALRDVTGTVESLPLICASILGKKLAEGFDCLVLDVKFGRGAFMPDLPAARELARALVDVGRGLGKPTRAVLTRMDEPLGRAVGNAVEVAEAIACLGGQGPGDVMEVTFALGAEMLAMAGLARGGEEARQKLQAALDSGAGMDAFARLVAGQGGDPGVIEDPARLPQAPLRRTVVAQGSGYVARVDARAIALAVLGLGAGRARASDAIDPAVGVTDLVKTGEKVAAGAVLATIHARTEAAAAEAATAVAAAIETGDNAPVRQPLVAERLG